MQIKKTRGIWVKRGAKSMQYSGVQLLGVKSRHILLASTLLSSAFLAGCNVNKPVDIAKVPTPEAASLHRPASIQAKDGEQTTTAKSVKSPVPTVEVAGLPANISKKTKFSSRKFGVKGSPRVAHTRNVRKGGGRYQIGKPYTIRGKRYYPKLDPNLRETGYASWYGPNFHGRLTANGEVYDQYALSAAHPTMPLPSYARVTNLENGSSLIVRVNDRGPFSRNRVIDLSARAAELLGYTKQGVAKVKIEYAGKAPLHGLDEEKLMASYNPGNLNPGSGTSGSVLAQSETLRENPAANTINEATSVGFTPSQSVQVPETGVIAVPRPEALVNVNSFMPDLKSGSKANTALDMITSGVRLEAPAMGMKNLVHIQFGPFENKAAILEAERILSGSGILETINLDKGSGKILHLVAAREEASDILEDATAADIAIYSSN